MVLLRLKRQTLEVKKRTKKSKGDCVRAHVLEGGGGVEPRVLIRMCLYAGSKGFWGAEFNGETFFLDQSPS